MKLADYLFNNSMSPSTLKEQLGLAHRSTVWRWMTDGRRPNRVMMSRLVELTRGEVTEADFRDPSIPKCAKLVHDGSGRPRLLLPWSSDHAPKSTDQTNGDELTVTPPIQKALAVLEGRATFTQRGTVLIDGRASDTKRLVIEANRVLSERKEEPIPYPGVEPLL